LIDPSELPSLPTSRRKARLLVAYFSYTGNTRRVAKAFAERLRTSCDVETAEIVPTHNRGYLHWLAYSFVPNSEVEIENPEMELSRYDAVLLGFPKWTLSCPPLNRFIRKLRHVNKPKFYLFMTCGGFDEQRFLDTVSNKLKRIGCNIAGSLSLDRKDIRRELHRSSIDLFAKRVEHLQ
jgi:hypothetical protein